VEDGTLLGPTPACRHGSPPLDSLHFHTHARITAIGKLQGVSSLFEEPQSTDGRELHLVGTLFSDKPPTRLKMPALYRITLDAAHLERAPGNSNCDPVAEAAPKIHAASTSGWPSTVVPDQARNSHWNVIRQSPIYAVAWELDPSILGVFLSPDLAAPPERRIRHRFRIDRWHAG